jgi:hypothetical protein
MKKHTYEEIEQAILEAVGDINMEQAVKSEPCYALADILGGKTVPVLRELAKLYKVQGYSNMNKQLLIKALIPKMTDDKIMPEYLMLLEEHEWKLFKQTAGVKSLIPDNFFVENYMMLLKSGMMELYYYDYNFYCVVPNEIKEIYKRLDTSGFTAEKEHSDLLHSYAMASAHLYGVISQDDFVDLFNSQNERKTNIDEVFAVLIKYIYLEYGYVFWDEYIVNDDFEQNDYKDVENCVKAANCHPRYTPSKEQLLKYADWDYFEETTYTKKVSEYINGYLSDDPDVTDEIIEKMVYASFADIKFQVLFDVLEEYKIEFNNQQQAERFTPLLVNMYNNSRKWSNSGHTPMELKNTVNVKPKFGNIGKDETYTYTVKKSEPDKYPKVGRNEPCPCGSGKKYKKCCIR